MQTFGHNDDGYLRWLEANPRGYVLNVRRRPDPNYVILHRATCHSISSNRFPYGAFTHRNYRKICAVSPSNLSAAARAQGRTDGSFSKRCSFCSP